MEIRPIYIVSTNSANEAVFAEKSAFTNEFDAVGYVMANTGLDADLMPSEALRILRLNGMVTIRAMGVLAQRTKKWKILKMICRY